MKAFTLSVLLVATLSLPVTLAQDAKTVEAEPSAAASKTGGCANCPAATASSDTSRAVAMKTIPGSNETMVVGSIENLIPIGILTVLGCEKCSAQAVNWALQQGSSFDDVERTLRTVAVMQKLPCFKDQFGPEVSARMEKPLAAARNALAEARTPTAK